MAVKKKNPYKYYVQYILFHIEYVHLSNDIDSKTQYKFTISMKAMLKTGSNGPLI